ncbi:hypothetical protein BU16DRAFT_521568 [Lophium mytilinum]|uniref:Uncharacterized protein n=1 Tax=Lophium mytilinum TaxID=390894 RepID=A0A6A6RGU0_9PEZI|nr:hypothetical protein BU16DRAFT_521568 [Lophium mytilinum]
MAPARGAITASPPLLRRGDEKYSYDLPPRFFTAIFFMIGFILLFLVIATMMLCSRADWMSNPRRGQRIGWRWRWPGSRHLAGADPTGRSQSVELGNIHTRTEGNRGAGSSWDSLNRMLWQSHAVAGREAQTPERAYDRSAPLREGNENGVGVWTGAERQVVR